MASAEFCVIQPGRRGVVDSTPWLTNSHHQKCWYPCPNSRTAISLPDDRNETEGRTIRRALVSTPAYRMSFQISLAYSPIMYLFPKPCRYKSGHVFYSWFQQSNKKLLKYLKKHTWPFTTHVWQFWQHLEPSTPVDGYIRGWWHGVALSVCLPL